MASVQKQWLKKPSWVQSQQKWQPRHATKKPQGVPADYELDPDARHLGIVLNYYKWRGFGFIRPLEKGLVPNDGLWVHWSNIQTEDRFPYLKQGMEVEFGIMKRKEMRHDVTTLRAKFVTLPGGSTIALQDEDDAERKTFVGGQNLRYTGTLKFYTPKGGYGYVVLDDGYQMDASVPQELRVEEAEVNACGKKPKQWLENLKVEFGIWKTQKGAYKVYNMTLPNMQPVTDENLEHRQLVGQRVHSGVVTYWNWRQRFGLIKPNDAASLPPQVHDKLAQMQQAAKQRGKQVDPEKVLFFRQADVEKGCFPRVGLPVSFHVYVDDKGAGACEVQG